MQVFENKKLPDVSKTLMDAFRVKVLQNIWKKILRGEVCETSQPIPHVPRPIHDTRGRLPLENFLQVFENEKLPDVSKTLMDALKVKVLRNR